MALKIKPGARPSFRLEMIKPRKVVEEIFADFNMTAWLTSGMDSEHGAGSLHYSGYAEDYDGEREISIAEWREIKQGIVNRLYDSRYQVIAHAGHVHIEYDPAEFKRFK